MKKFCNYYRIQFAAFPVNSQFTERGVKESGHVSLGRRNEINRSLIAISCAKIMPEALQDYRNALQPDSITDTEDDYEGNNINKKIMQLTGKHRADFLMNALIEHNREIKELRKSINIF